MYSSSIERLLYAKRPLHCAKQQFPFCFPSLSYQAELEQDTHLRNNQLALPCFRFNKIVAYSKIFPFLPLFGSVQVCYRDSSFEVRG